MPWGRRPGGSRCDWADRSTYADADVVIVGARGPWRTSELLDSVRRICLELPVVGVDVVEVGPPYDHGNITAALANRVVLQALSAIARKRRDERGGITTWDPRQPLLDGR
jgi:hypothetical protein